MRALLAASAVAACAPYLVLKVAWVAGSQVGGVPPEMATPTYRVANLVTIGLDAVLVVLVVALVSGRARRVPAGLVLVPMWVGTGLLSPVAVGVPIGVLVQLLTGGSAVPADAGLEPWVFALVYGGFVVQAVVLTAAFGLYVAERWPWLVVATPPPRLTGPVRQLLLTLVVLAVPAAVLHGMVFGMWAVTGGQPGGDPSALETVAQRTTYAVRALLPLLGAAGTITLLTRGMRPIALVCAWLGSSYLFAAGLFGGPSTTLGRFMDIVGVGSGLTLATAGIVTLLGVRGSLGPLVPR